MTGIVVDPEQTQDPAALAAAAAVQAAQAPAQTPSEDDLPEKYRGKSLKDIIAMHQHAESELGRKNNEVGVIRKLADELIGVRAAEKQANQPPRKPITSDEVLSNPEEAILSVVKQATEESVRAQEARLAKLETDLRLEAFEKKHVGYKDTMNSPAFGQWLQSGSDYRRRLALQASQGDFDAADELFGLYSDFTASAGAAAPVQSAQPSPASGARAATLARSGGSTPGGVVPAQDSKKVWSRAELLDMRINRPDEFDMRQAEILAAYAEKRVR